MNICDMYPNIDLTAKIDDIAHAVRRSTPNTQSAIDLAAEIYDMLQAEKQANINTSPSSPKKTADEIINEQFERCRAILTAKNDEYNVFNDRLHNFRVAAELQHTSVLRALYGMMAKHVVSIADMCQGGEYTLEQWEEKITDNINYLVLLRVAIEMEVEDESNNA